MYFPTQVDPQMFNKHIKGELVGQVSGHIDDLKGASCEAERDLLLKNFEKRYGKLKLSIGSFEHVGIQHVKQADGSYVLHQHHYVEQLHPLSLDDIKDFTPDQAAPEHLVSPYISLVCAMAWTLVTSPTVCVYVSALQRYLAKPCAKHLQDANRVLRYLKVRKPQLVFQKLEGPLRLLMVSDAAFTALDQQGLALRGYFVLLAQTTQGLSGRMHVLEYASRKQSHVCRATFSAELFSLLDGIGAALKVSLCLEEMLVGTATAAVLAERQETGKLRLRLHAVVDAKSVFDSVANVSSIKVSDEHLLIHILKVREFITRGIVFQLWWCDTRDMVSDGLTKGSVERTGILDLCEKGSWTLLHNTASHPVHR